MLPLLVGPPYKGPSDVLVDIGNLGHENYGSESQMPVELLLTTMAPSSPLSQSLCMQVRASVLLHR